MAKSQLRVFDPILIPIVAWFLTFFLLPIVQGLWTLLEVYGVPAMWLGWVYLIIGIACIVISFIGREEHPSRTFFLYIIAIMCFIIAFDILVVMWSQSQWVF